MDKIPSFTIDHNRLKRGIYVSRKDIVGGETVTTFDIRMKEPNREPVIHQGAIHTIEHLAATYLRNDKDWKDKIIYWGEFVSLGRFNVTYTNERANDGFYFVIDKVIDEEIVLRNPEDKNGMYGRYEKWFEYTEKTFAGTNIKYRIIQD